MHTRVTPVRDARSNVLDGAMCALTVVRGRRLVWCLRWVHASGSVRRDIKTISFEPRETLESVQGRGLDPNEIGALRFGAHHGRRFGALGRAASINCRIASERVMLLRRAQASISAISSVGMRTPTSGSRPVAGRPRFFGLTVIDLGIKWV